MQPGRLSLGVSKIFTPLTAGGKRQRAAAVMLLLAFTTSLFFYGIGVNLAVLLVVAVLLMLALSTLGIRRLAAAFLTNRSCWGALLAIAYLCISYRWSVSPDSSFAPSFILAGLPLAFIAATAMNRQLRQLLLPALMVIIVAFAVHSLADFLIAGERAHAPMTDPNNYATLMYLCWIPLVHSQLSRSWTRTTEQTRTPRWQSQWHLLPEFVLLMAMFATYSRVAVVVVAVALLIWSLLALSRGFAVLPVLPHAVLAASAYALVTFLSPAHIDNVTQVHQVAQGLDERLALIQSAFTMLQQGSIMGIGVFCFPLLYPAYRSVLDQDTAGLFVHNDYVQFLVEGGIPLLLFLLGFVLWMLVRFWRLASGDPRQIEKAGPAMAVCAAAAHASINFVFYSLTLAVLIGVLAAVAATDPVARNDDAGLRMGISPNRLKPGLLLGLLFGWTCIAYLLLDTATYAVFQGQKGLPFVAAIRQDPHRAIHFARSAERLNGNRGVPVLAEAMLLAHESQLAPGSEFLRQRALIKYRQAEQVDPWNPQVYLEFGRFLASTERSHLTLQAAETHRDLLLKAISLDPLFVPALNELLALFQVQGDYRKRYALLRRLVYPWMKLLQRHDPETATRYMKELRSYALATGDKRFQQELERQQKLLQTLRPMNKEYSLSGRDESHR